MTQHTNMFVTPSGQEINAFSGSPTIINDQILSISGISANIYLDSVIFWDPVVPGVTNTWTNVNASTTNTWTKIKLKE